MNKFINVVKQFFIFSAVFLFGYYILFYPKLVVSVNSNVKSVSQIFYQSLGKEVYSEEMSRLAEIKTGEQLISFEIPSYDYVLRFDFANKPYDIAINEMYVRVFFFKIPIPNLVQHNQEFRNIIYDNGKIKIETLSNAIDPQVFIKADSKKVKLYRFVISFVFGLLALLVFILFRKNLFKYWNTLESIQIPIILSRKIDKLIYLVIILILTGFYIYQINYPVDYDALQYLIVGKKFVTYGLLNGVSAEMRLYGYPFFISIFYLFLPDYLIGYFLFITQTILYIVASLLIANKIGKFSEYGKRIVWIALLSNIFLYPYLSMSLSDAMSVVFWLLIAYFIIILFQSFNKKIIINYFYFLVLSFLIGFSIMIRPANLHLIILLPMLIILIYFLNRKNLSKFFIANATLISIIGFLLAVLPQLYINYKLFDVISFLPAMNLGDAQIGWGINNIKYATNLSGIGNAGMFYINPFVVEGSKLSISYYFLNPIEGIITIFLHIFGALDFDYFFPYIYNINPSYSSILFLISHTIVYFGVLGYFCALLNLRKNKIESVVQKNFYTLLIFVVPLAIIGWAAIIGISVPENRFSLPIVTLLMPFAFFALHHFTKNKNKKVLFLFLLYLIFAYFVSDFISMQKNIY